MDAESLDVRQKVSLKQGNANHVKGSIPKVVLVVHKVLHLKHQMYNQYERVIEPRDGLLTHISICILRQSMLLFLYTFLALSICVVRSCRIDDNTLTGKRNKLVNVEPVTTSIKHTIYGTVTFTTGCHFVIRNLTIIPSGNGLYWYGIPLDAVAEPDPFPRVVQAAVSQYNGQTATFTLDQQYNLSSIAVMMLYSEGDHRAYGAFSVMGNVSNHFTSVDPKSVILDPNDPLYTGAASPSHSLYILGSSSVIALIMSIVVFG